MSAIEDQKVSCLCITHDRIELLKKSIELFKSQTYKNKELIILFENDLVTAQFIEENKDYNYVELHEQGRPSPNYFIVPATQEFHLKNGLKVAIKNDVGYQFQIENDSVSLLDPETEEFDFVIEDCNENKSFKLKSNAYWLIQTNSGLEVTQDVTKATSFSYTTHLNSLIELVTIDSQLPDFYGTERVNWEEKTVHQGKENNITFYRMYPSKQMSLGMKRNLSIRAAKGDYMCVWDDDDWYSPERIESQMKFLLFSNKVACALLTEVFFDHNEGHTYHMAKRPSGQENTMVFEKKRAGQYGNLNMSEDTFMLHYFYNKNQIAVMDSPDLYIYSYHKRNTCSRDHFKLVKGWAKRLTANDDERVKNILEIEEATV